MPAVRLKYEDIDSSRWVHLSCCLGFLLRQLFAKEGSFLFRGRCCTTHLSRVVRWRSGQ